MTGNLSKAKGFKGDTGPIGPPGPQGEPGVQGIKGDTPSIVFRLDPDTGDLYYSSDGILVDKEYVASQNLATKEELKNKADNATTLAGYGITDAYTKQQVDEEYVKRISEYDSYIQSRAGEIAEEKVQGLRFDIQEKAHFCGYLLTNAKIQEMEATPNDYAYSAESGTKWVYDAIDGWKDTGVFVPDQLTPPSDTTPLMNGEAFIGYEFSYARGDHRHPTDTSRASVQDLNKKADKTETVYFSKSIAGDGTVVLLDDNKEYIATEPMDNLIIGYSEGDFFASLYFTLASSGTITVTLPESKYIGEVPDFKNGETWELSIKNGVVVGGKVV